MNNENPDLDRIIEEVRSELRNILLKRRELIEKLGFAFEKVVANEESICEEIKTTLRDEIAEKAISSRDIERYCPDKWKKKTKPQKNDNLSFSDLLEHGSQKEVVIGNTGTSIDETSPCGSDSAGVNQQRNILIKVMVVDNYQRILFDMICSISTMIHMILSLPYPLMMYKVMRALRLS
jgi:hypothetical protein